MDRQLQHGAAASDNPHYRHPHHGTVNVALPLTVPAVAVIVTDPKDLARAVPELVESLLISTIAAFDELHVTDASCCVKVLVPS